MAGCELTSTARIHAAESNAGIAGLNTRAGSTDCDGIYDSWVDSKGDALL